MVAGSRVFFAAAVLLFLASIIIPAVSYRIQVGISETIASEAKQVRHTEENNFVALNYDIYNSGSTEYAARLRLDIYGNSTENAGALLAAVWGAEVPLAPGERKPAAVYWYGGNSAENLSGSMRVYRAQEISDAGEFAIELKNITAAASAFKIEKARTYDNEIKLRIKSSEDADNIVVYPVRYPKGWLFEQEEIGNLKKNNRKWVTVRYEPALFSERSITFAIAGNNGRFYSEQTIALRKESGLSGYMHRIQDWLV